MPYPYIRKAEPHDYDSIWSIWMQDHIIQWMSFPKQTKEEFATHYAHMEKASEIYVLIDNIEGEEKVVAVRRLKVGKDQYRHIAEYCSMGVDEQYRGKGYAKILYQEFEKIAREKGIKRIQLTQSGGNEIAFHLADKNFFEEAVFPDWLERSKNKGNYYLIERYVYRILDEDLAAKASELPTLKYKEVFPQLIAEENESIQIERVNNQFICSFQGKTLLTVDYEPDDSVIQHIGFLSVNLHSPDHQSEATAGLRKILLNLLEEGRVKKVELFTAEPAVAELCKNVGFFVRGEKIASHCEDEEYKNEVGVEYSFFDIQDAKKIIIAQVSDPIKRDSINEALSLCSKTITSLVDDKTCDIFAAKYLENLIYQMVRDELGPNKVFSLSDKRWQPLLIETPESLHNDLLRLTNRLQNSEPTFFKKETSVFLPGHDFTLNMKL